MLEYDFNEQFNDKEFENLGCDIIETREDFLLERHNKVKDLGIDGRNITNDKVTIVQCKHYKDIKKLMEDLNKIELAKVKKLNPERYILVLSLNITVKQKEKIQVIFNGYIKSTNDILGKEDLNGYFRKEKYQTIKKYYDDLLLSKNINLRELLEKIKNPIVAQNSKFLLNDIEETKKYFIETKTFLKSYEILKENHIIFLSGDAGSGKTTNAKMLLNNLFKDDLIDMAYKVNTCDELMSIINTNERQGILFDDFWGSTFEYLKLELNEERKLQDIIERIGRIDSTYLILTTREYVLNQGISFYKDFNNIHLDKRVIHKNCNYSDSEKIKILFSHVKNSNLDSKYLHIIKYYAKEIIRQINYSPRSVSFFINKNEDKNINEYKFIEEFIDYLENPTKYLESIFYKLSEGAQVLAFTLALSDPEILLPQLQKSFQAIAKHIPSIKPSKYEDYLKELLDFFVEINKYRNNIINFTNHSIHDFINNEFLKRLVDYEDSFCKGVIYFNQIFNLMTYEKYKLSKENVDILITKLIKDFNNLIITQDLDAMIEAEESESINPFRYKSHKIWKSLLILEFYSVEELKIFLKKEIINLLDYYGKHLHDYENSNYEIIPELISRAQELKIEFNENEIVKKYINNCELFYELYYIKYFPKKYKETINKYLKKLGENLKDKVEYWILENLDYLSEDGITMEYEETIENMSKILKMLGLKPTQALQKIIKENKKEKIKPINNEIKIQPPKRKKEEIEKEIEKYEKEVYSIHNLTQKELKKIILESNLKEENKIKIKKSLNEKASIWELIRDSSLEYANLIINFYEKEEKKQQEIITDWQIYKELLDYIKKESKLKDSDFLEEYAYETIMSDYNFLSKKHLLTKYSILEEQVETLINLGVLKKINNIIYITDTLFNIYLATKYLKDKNDKKILYDFLNRDGIRCNLENIFMEYFNTYNYHHNIIAPILKSIMKKGKDEWSKDILDFSYDKENENYNCSWNSDYWILDDFISIIIHASLKENIEIILNNNLKNSKVTIKEFYFNKNNQLDESWKKIDVVLNYFYNIIEEIYNIIKEDESCVIEFEK